MRDRGIAVIVVFFLMACYDFSLDKRDSSVNSIQFDGNGADTGGVTQQADFDVRTIGVQGGGTGGESSAGSGGSGGDGAAGTADSCVPSAEACDNLDNDCDGQTDEGLVEICGSSVGVCKPGNRICLNGTWSECKGGVEPSAEVCDGAKDENCDGTVDEACSCAPNGATRVCGSNIGTCKEGSQKCNNGIWSDCIGLVTAAIEVCDNQDDDCDGQTDEELSRACGADVGECTAGTETCSYGQWAGCTAVGSATEMCDGKDNDCDGQTDEGLIRDCGTDVGECSTGTETCSYGQWAGCTAVSPVTEICDGKDNDCDGQTDEGCDCVNGNTRGCGVSIGACKAGTQACVNGKWSDICENEQKGTNEVCDGIDNDCDGKTDESLSQGCGRDDGECAKGTETCSNGQWVGCTAVGPATEMCDGKDNDCDGQTDDGSLCSGTKNRCVNGRCVQCVTNSDCAGVGGVCRSDVCAYCGDGAIQSDLGEECEDGNTTNTDACINCKNARCGDGYLWSGYEACDDGNTSNTDACLTSCQTATCGDGYIRAGVEECEPGVSGWVVGTCNTTNCQRLYYRTCHTNQTTDCYKPDNNYYCSGINVCIRSCTSSSNCPPAPPGSSVVCYQNSFCALSCNSNTGCPTGLVCISATSVPDGKTGICVNPSRSCDCTNQDCSGCLYPIIG